MGVWTQQEAIALCGKIEAVCPAFGCHVALTGGLLYKDGKRKDADILFYRIRQVDEIDIDGLFEALSEIGVKLDRGFGWCFKATFDGKPIDCFFPEEQGGEYEAPDRDEHPMWSVSPEDEAWLATEVAKLNNEDPLSSGAEA